MSPAEAREALERAFPGMEWRAGIYEPRTISSYSREPAVILVVDIGDDGTATARVDRFEGGYATSESPADAVREAIAEARTHLIARLAALDAATETP